MEGLRIAVGVAVFGALLPVSRWQQAKGVEESRVFMSLGLGSATYGSRILVDQGLEGERSQRCSQVFIPLEP